MACDLFAIPSGAAENAVPFLIVSLDGVPRGKGRHRSRIVFPKVGKPFITQYPDPESVKYETALAWKAKAAMKGRAPLTGPLAIRVFATVPIPKSWPQRDKDAAVVGTKHATWRPDADNYLKNVDALNGIVWNDDAQVVCALVVKRYGESPGLAIEVYRI